MLPRVETTPAQLEWWNPNLIGGDTGEGSLLGTQQFFVPLFLWSRTGWASRGCTCAAHQHRPEEVCMEWQGGMYEV